jgi:hypothetical protein
MSYRTRNMNPRAKDILITASDLDSDGYYKHSDSIETDGSIIIGPNIGWVKFKGDLVTEGFIDAPGSGIDVGGSITAGACINVSKGITAGGFMKSGAVITSFGHITAGSSIIAVEGINALSIRAETVSGPMFIFAGPVVEELE